MAHKKFNVDAWASVQNTTNQIVKPESKTAYTQTDGDLEIIMSRIEEAHVDIVPSYDDWVKAGFALAELKGEGGREYFHRLSRLHDEYDQAFTDKQYTECLKGRKSGITGGTFFHYVKSAGVDIHTGKETGVAFPKPSKSPFPQNGDNGEMGDEEAIEMEILPSFSDKIADKLPIFLQKVVVKGNSSREKDIMLIASILVLSGCLPHISGKYDCRKVYANLYFFLSGPASSGKGQAYVCRSIIQPIHDQMRAAFKTAMTSYNAAHKEWEERGEAAGYAEPEMPKDKMLIIPANSSSTSVYQILNDNGGFGVIFETEADTITNSIAKDYVNYSDGLRKAFHHERISYHRRTGGEYVDIENPRLSVLLTGTPKQVTSLLKSPEDGLVSRFMFYQLDSNLAWKDVWSGEREKSLEEYFTGLGELFIPLYYILNERTDDLKFNFTKGQQERFNKFFAKLQDECYIKLGEDSIASTRRMGLIFFRIAMVFSALRMMETEDYFSPLICTDQDFDSVMEITGVLIQHTMQILERLAKRTSNKSIVGSSLSKINVFFNELPDEFDCQDRVELSMRLGIPPKTSEKWITKLCSDNGPLEHAERGKYRKRAV